MKSRTTWTIVALLLVVTTTLVWPQRRGGFRRSASSGGRNGVPEWTNPSGFERDVFTFARVEYDSTYGGRGRGGGWTTDYRDADLNFSYRLQQLTALRVDPEGTTLRLTNPDLFNHPFIYIVEPGRLEFSDEEVQTLRRYLLSGGFLMVDDFWGEVEYENLY
jgi:hypothetical protein